jgi:hypothetical protein
MWFLDEQNRPIVEVKDNSMVLIAMGEWGWIIIIIKQKEYLDYFGNVKNII